MSMLIKGKAKTLELEEKLLDMILRNNLKEGDIILPENKLVELFGVSRVTVRHALANLTEKNILYKVKGKGTFVSKIEKFKKNATANYVDKTIALVIPRINNSYFADMARGVEDVATNSGYQVSFRSNEGNLEKEAEQLQELSQKNVAGIIFSPTESMPLAPATEEICATMRNLVFVDASPSRTSCDIVTCDDAEGAYLATKHLIDSGHRRIAHIRGPLNVSNAHERYSGYLKAMLEAFGEHPQSLVAGGKTYSAWEGKEKTLELMERPTKSRPTAIFAASDSLASGVYEAAQEMKLSIPDDFSLVGYGDVLETIAKGYFLTTVKQNGFEVGKNAAKLLLRKLEKIDASQQKILIPPTLTMRNTTKSLN